MYESDFVRKVSISWQSYLILFQSEQTDQTEQLEQSEQLDLGGIIQTEINFSCQLEWSIAEEANFFDL